MSQGAQISPPKFALKFLRWFCDDLMIEDVEGDLCEIHHTRGQENLKRANRLFILDVLLLFRPGMIKNLLNSNSINNSMLQNHIKIAFRHALKYKGYTMINVLGLTIGIAASLLILLWVQDEVSRDQFHAKSENIYQVWRNMYQASGEISTTPGIPQPLEIVLREEYPEIQQVTLLSWEMESLFRIEDEKSYEIGRYASPEFFKVFSFPFIIGDSQKAMKDPHSVVISQDLALKYFGEDWKNKTLGQTFKLDERQDFVVTGVFEKLDKNSSLDFDWILPAQEYIQRKSWIESWYNGGFRIYISLRDDANLPLLRAKVEQEINEHTNHDADERIVLQKFTDTYLYSDWENGLPAKGRIQYVQILSIIALFILVIACVNFMNLATARSSKRSKEIGVRKVMGALRNSLSRQFLIESILMSFISVSIALLLVILILPYFNAFTGKEIILDFYNLQNLGILLGIVLTIGLLSGSYPAIMLSSMKVINSLKGTTANSGKDSFLRNGLVVFQFSLSIILIIGTLIVSKQMDFILNKNLGLDKENLLSMNLEGELEMKEELFKDQLLKFPDIKDVTFVSGNPLDYGSSTGGATWDGKNPDDVIEINVMTVGTDFVKTLGIELAHGRDFSLDMASDSANYLINEVAAKAMGFSNAIDQNLRVWGVSGKVVGVIRDFHMGSMYEPIGPLIVRFEPGNTGIAYIRTSTNVQSAIKNVEKVAVELNPNFPFSYSFLDKEYESSYRSEQVLSGLVNLFALISIFISCLGLLGLSSYSSELRAKEIGVRKVLGASVSKVVFLLSKDYGKLIVVAFIIAAPVAFYLANQWLSAFEFRVDVDVLLFVLAGVFSFMIGLITVGVKSYQAAIINPVKTLKDE